MKSKILVADKSNMSGLYKRVMLSNYRELLFLVLIIILANSSIILLPNDLIKAFVKESGFIENAQVLCYVACAIISWVYAKKKLWKSGLSGGIIFMVFALRELDIQKRFTIMSVTKTKFFISPEVTLNAKLISGAVITSILIILILFIRKNYATLFNGLRAAEKWAFSTITGIVLIGVAVVLDSLIKQLKDFGIIIVKEIEYLLMMKMSEEMVELAIPIFFLMALLQWRKTVLNRNLN
jgi:hypothetical protein